MRITNGDNPLDATSVHPESYEAANNLLKKLGLNVKDIKSGNLVGLSLIARIPRNYLMNSELVNQPSKIL